jgi:hypothetical protein
MWRVRGTLAPSRHHCEERSRDEAISTRMSAKAALDRFAPLAMTVGW